MMFILLFYYFFPKSIEWESSSQIQIFSPNNLHKKIQEKNVFELLKNYLLKKRKTMIFFKWYSCTLLNFQPFDPLVNNVLFLLQEKDNCHLCHAFCFLINSNQSIKRIPQQAKPTMLCYNIFGNIHNFLIIAIGNLKYKFYQNLSQINNFPK